MASEICTLMDINGHHHALNMALNAHKKSEHKLSASYTWTSSVLLSKWIGPYTADKTLNTK